MPRRSTSIEYNYQKRRSRPQEAAFHVLHLQISVTTTSQYNMTENVLKLSTNWFATLGLLQRQITKMDRDRLTLDPRGIGGKQIADSLPRTWIVTEVGCLDPHSSYLALYINRPQSSQIVRVFLHCLVALRLRNFLDTISLYLVI